MKCTGSKTWATPSCRRAIWPPVQRGYDAITIIKLKDFYTLLEELQLDRCEDVANVIEGITIKKHLYGS